MISIIVSTYKPQNFFNFSENIKLNIGIDYEIIKIENKGKYSLCEAYNIGIEQVKYPYVCFCHDDILINRNNWGQYVIEEFNKYKDIGLLGVAGNTYKTYSPSAWFLSDEQKYQAIDICHKNQDSEKNVHFINRPSSSNFNKAIEEVVVLDGVWLFTSKKIIEEYRFDDKLFTGYHCYDLDFSFQVGEKYKLGVIYGLDILHLSKGDYNMEWVLETFKLHEKWKSKLPLGLKKEQLTKNEIQNNEFKVFQIFMAKVFYYDTPLLPLLKLLYNPRLIQLMGLKYWSKVSKWASIQMFQKLIKK